MTDSKNTESHRRAAGETRALLLALAGREPSDAAAVRSHGRADQVVAAARGVESETGTRNLREQARGKARCPRNRAGNRPGCRLT